MENNTTPDEPNVELKEQIRKLREMLNRTKKVRTPSYNYNYDTENGNFARWGTSVVDDPLYAPIGPEILDMEISTSCSGVGNTPCKHCYKANTHHGENMSFETFKTIFEKMPSITQIAFGIGDVDGNPDLFRIFDFCRIHHVAPNVTINGARLTNDIATALSICCGAVAVSRYENKNYCYDAIKQLTDLGMKQINIHMMVSEETYDMCMETLQDSLTDPRLEKLNAIVMLLYKPKGRGVGQYTNIKLNRFKELVEYGMSNGISIGFDSCGAPLFIECIKDRDDYEQLLQTVECCESSLFSAYINVKGEYFPCSFMEGEPGWEKGIDVVACEDFLNDVWYDERVKAFRKSLTSQGVNRKCPHFDLYGEIELNCCGSCCTPA